MLAPSFDSDIQSAVAAAQAWLAYEGVAHVSSSRTSTGDTIVVLTTCNPAAITAPIPSTFQGFSVIFCQTSAN
ncbi:hypothetical protein [Ketobacter nezhaii]